MPALDDLLKRERGRLVARLARSLGLDRLGLAEDAVQHACEQALAHWPQVGTPDNPAGWLYRTARHHAIDRLRADAKFDELPDDDGPSPIADTRMAAPGPRFAGELDDDELALLFAACHPALPPPTQVALALRALAGMGLETLADGLLTTETALAQRLARARERLRDVALEIPAGAALPPRRDSVLTALAVMFNAGWEAGAADPRAWCWEAIRLARAVAAHRSTAHPDADALAAMLLLHGARLTGRHDAAGDIVPLPGQPRDRWDQGMLRMGFVHMQRAQVASSLSRWHLQAGIAAAHAVAPDYERTDWALIVGYYRLLVELDPSAAPRLGHAIALAEGGDIGPARVLLETLLPTVPGALKPHTLAALALVAQREGRLGEALQHLEAAAGLARHDADRRLLQRRAAALRGTATA